MTARALLDGPTIRRRRRELGLSERTVSRALGINTSAVHNLERNRNDAELPLAVICRLADLLGTSIDELRPRPRTQPTGGDAGDAGQDAADVGALIAADDRLVPVTVLAEVLGWRLDRTEAAIEVLEVTLAAAGLRLHRLYGDVKVVPALAPPERLQALTRRALARRGLLRRHADLLSRAARGTLRTALGNADRVALATLLNAGILEDPPGDRGESPVLTADARYSLLLDEEETPAIAAPRFANTRRTRKVAASQITGLVGTG